MNKNDLLNLAIVVATNAHRGQKDKQGQPYILHPLRVMTNPRLVTDDERIIAVLHDVLEDTETSEQDLIDIFGTDIVSKVKILSRSDNEDYKSYINRLCIDDTIMKVKLSDIEDNLRDGCPESSRKRYFDAMITIKNKMNS